MVETAQRPEGQVADAVSGNWVDHRAPAWSRPYLRLSRADRPVGTWLLFIPCLWGLLLSAGSGPGGLGWHGLWIAIGCGLGAWLMRGAGCTWNDITDRKFDAQVARTRSRPIPSGQVSATQAFKWCCIQAVIALCILLSFNSNAIWLGVAALAPVAIYPFAKRFTWWPQLFLGIAFNWGALMAWTAHHGSLAWPAIWLYLAGIAWTLFYDTIYAHQDSDDDALIGVKSTARLFAENSPKWLARFQWATLGLLLLAVITAFLSHGQILPMMIAMLGVTAMGAHLQWQRSQLNIEDPSNCLRLFRANRDAGLILAIFFTFALWL
ncbi:MAG: 4-hydroxybenzoate octaprenyltransferase [Mangrovicoccus sp.]|nr:4-hydroxybenzoate octaprenyltransferase [Mangrovicoccus sp.]